MFHNVPGMAALVVKDGAVIWSKGYGHADIAQQIPVTADTVFHIGSISKPFVATTVMQLWETGEFGLDDDVNDYLAFPVRNPKFPDAPITFRMLLQHTSGMTDFGAFANIHLISLGADSPMTLGEYLEGHLDPSSPTYNPAIWSAAQPGAGFQYSNPAWTLLAYLVEQISGTPFDQYCTQNIFVPLGMNQTTWRLGDLFAANIAPAIPYFWLNSAQSFQIPIGHHSFPNYAAAGLRSSANDLSKFLLAHMNGGTHNGVSILQPETVELMQAMVVVSPLG